MCVCVCVCECVCVCLCVCMCVVVFIGNVNIRLRIYNSLYFSIISSELLGIRNPVSTPSPTERPLTGGNVKSKKHSKRSPVTG